MTTEGGFKAPAGSSAAAAAKGGAAAPAQQQSQQEKRSDAPATVRSRLLAVLAFFKNLKMIHVVKYVVRLVRDLCGGRAALLAPRNARDNAKRLLALVWPERWVGAGVSPDAARTRSYLLVMGGVGLANLFLMAQCSDLTSHLTSALYKRQSGRVRALLGRGVRMSAGIALLSTALTWATSRLEVHWRSQIIRTLHGLYFDNMACVAAAAVSLQDACSGHAVLSLPHRAAPPLLAPCPPARPPSPAPSPPSLCAPVDL